MIGINGQRRLIMITHLYNYIVLLTHKCIRNVLGGPRK